MDPELKVMNQILKTLKPLDDDQRARVLMAAHLMLNIPCDQQLVSEKFRLITRSA